MMDTNDSEFEIVQAVVDQLELMIISDVKIFAEVTSSAKSSGCEPERLSSVKYPRAIVAYCGSSSRDSLDGLVCRTVCLSVSIYLRVKPASSSADRLSDLLDMVRRVRNYIEQNPPEKSCAWADRYGHNKRVSFSDTKLHDSGHSPWVCASLTLNINTVIE